MRIVTTFALLFLALGAASAADQPTRTPFAEVPVTGLDAAARQGIVRGGGEKPRGYSRVILVLENRTNERQAIDVAGRFLRPRTRGSCQRLGIGPAVTPRLTARRGPGTIVVNLEPRQTRKIEMNTVCLDAGLASPSSHDFDIAEAPLPPVRGKVMRWWADHPDTPQYAVNSAIWQNREKVHVPRVNPNRHRAPVWGRPAGHAGTVLRLRNGELLSRDPDGLVRFLGTEIRQVFPTENGVFAIAPGENRERELWRLAQTGKNPWSRVSGIDENVEVKDVFSVGKVVVIVRTDGIDLVRGGEVSRVLSGPEDGFPHLSAWPTRRGLVRIVRATKGTSFVYQGGERKSGRSRTIVISELDPKSGKLRTVRENWNLRSAATGPAGSFALSHGANLRRFNGRSWKTFGPNLPWSRILRVGRKHLWVVDRQDRLALVSASTGSVKRRLTTLAPADADFALDRTTDDLLVRRGDGIRRIEAATGDVSKIEFGDE